MLKTLKFVQGAVAKKDHVPVLQHFHIENGRIKGYNGVLSLSAPINFDLNVNPLAKPFTRAIQACKGNIAMHMTDAGRLAITSGSFKAFIDCDPTEYPDIKPQGEELKFEGKFLNILKRLEPFIAEDASRSWARGILFKGPSAFATNNVVLVQSWMGYTVPVDINIPKEAIAEILRINEEPEHIQVTANTVTFHFSGDRWLITRTLATDWPNLEPIFEVEHNAEAPPPDLFSSLEDLLPFCTDEGAVYLSEDGYISSNEDPTAGALIEVSGVNHKGSYAAKYLSAVGRVANTVDFSAYPKPCLFFGENLRGAIMGRMY